MNPHEIDEKTVEFPGGKLPLRLFKNEISTMIARSILSGSTYPPVSFVSGVQTVVDVGANVGAASIFFALQYPTAKIFALEPASQAYSLLAQNVAPLPNITTFHCGLFSSDRSVPLYLGRADSVESSVCPNSRTESQPEQVQLRSAERFVKEQGIHTIDVLKIDTEGCEIHILQSLKNYLPAIKLIYVEYHSDRDRRLIDSMLAATHNLWRGHADLIHRGEFCYLNKRLVPDEKQTFSVEILLPLE